MNKEKETITSYTDNKIGSGQYCECGQELTHCEWQSRKYVGILSWKCGHRDKGVLK